MTESGRPWAFDAPGEHFKLAVEAYRIHLAHLFDPMMAVHTSNVEPLPHQITAVYESMLPRQPLRYLLADDPGAGKTIMAGLLIRELLIRADAKRVLIVAPGSLVEQWQDEMFEKFSLSFTLFAREQVETSPQGNPFEHFDLLIARIDQLARAEDLQEKLRRTQWDVIVVDEAHKLSANYFGNKVNKTKRFQLGELLGAITRHFLLMTATPHNGKEEDFQLFLSLLDPDRFYGKFRDDAHKVDVSDLMRRRVKEEMVKFDGSRLFPERRTYTVDYKLSDPEAALYAAVTDYVKTEFARADQLDGARKGTVGFALATLQRRLASSPEAIYQSLKRRRSKLKARVAEEKSRQRGQWTETLPTREDIWESDDDMSSEDYENFEEELVDQATAAQTLQELEAEIVLLEALEEQARQLVHSGQDRKWDELSRLLQDTPEMHDATGRQRKLILFTEHRDTLNYLAVKIRGLIGNEEAVVVIHGGVKREERRKAQEQFRNDPTVRLLIATDAAGEGVNLQNANLMVNYDLPWNPNRLEQRFGRIHRINQTEVCHLWNLVAFETREGDVFRCVLDKLGKQRDALEGRVFDVLGKVFEGKSLKHLMIEAIRYGEDPVVRARMYEKISDACQQTPDILHRRALCKEVMDNESLFAVKEAMERAEARKLQPLFIRAFFNQAFSTLGGELRPRERGRFEITNVPVLIRERDRGIADPHADPVLRRYERVCFEKQHVNLTDRVGAPMASLLHAGHPLVRSVTDLILEQHSNTLKQGAVLVDQNDMGLTPKVIFIIDHSIKEGSNPAQMASRRLQFVKIDHLGKCLHAGWAPHLDLDLLDADKKVLIEDLLSAQWIAEGLKHAALDYARRYLVPEHFTEVRAQREKYLNKVLVAVNERLLKEINHYSTRYDELKKSRSAGKDVRLALENVRRLLDHLSARRHLREKELLAQLEVISATPVILGGALVIPAGLLMQRGGISAEQGSGSPDAAARARIERIAMQKVMEAEREMGFDVTDVSANNWGWDITSQPKPVGDVLPPARHIEVKGRAKGQPTITVTHNEIKSGLNQSDKFILAIVLVDGDNTEGPFYVRQPFTQAPDWAETSKNFDLTRLLTRAVSPEASR